MASPEQFVNEQWLHNKKTQSLIKLLKDKYNTSLSSAIVCARNNQPQDCMLSILRCAEIDELINDINNNKQDNTYA